MVVVVVVVVPIVLVEDSRWVRVRKPSVNQTPLNAALFGCRVLSKASPI